MDQALDSYRGQIEALMRAMSVAKIIREDKDPCTIEETVHDRDDVNISNYFEECFDFIEKAKGKIEEAKGQGGGVLVHCFAGKSRSATIVIAYLMKKHGMSLSEAFQLVKSKRPVISPNAGFMIQLQNYDKALKDIFGLVNPLLDDTRVKSLELTRSRHSTFSFERMDILHAT
nr:dual specificity protein phosphatase 1-like isoform X3 [Nicotiana tomentosiformis]